MTASEAITQVDSLVPNACSQTVKEAWLERLEGQVRRELEDTHEAPVQPQPGQLRIPAPYDECYIRYLEAQIHYTHAEMTRYTNAMLLFNTVYSNFAAWYHRTHMPLSPERKEAIKCAIPPI